MNFYFETIVRFLCFLFRMPPFKPFFSLVVILSFISVKTWSQTGELGSPEDLKKLSLEELLNIEVTSVSRRPEKLSEVASAIQVITREDIRRSGATHLPEALRLAPNLQVAQLNSSLWIMSAHQVWEISLKGQSLWEDQHREFSAVIPRSIYGNVTCRF